MRQGRDIGELILFILAVCGLVMAIVIGCLGIYGALTEEKPTVYLKDK